MPRHSLPNGHASFTLLTWCPALILIGAAGFAFASDAAVHDRELWQSIIEHEYAVPADQSLPALTRELTGLLGSPDPDLRDEVGYPILAACSTRCRPGRLTSRPTAADLRARQNITNLFAKLEVLLTLQDSAPEPVAAARDSLRRALKALY